MTSNVASDVIRENIDDPQEMNTKVWEVLNTYFKPEFLNRLDSVVIYKPLGAKEIMEIARLQLERVKVRLAENDITLVITDELVSYFAEEGYDAVFGARPLRRLIEEKLVDEIALRVIDGSIKPNDTVKLLVKDQKIVIE